MHPCPEEGRTQHYRAPEGFGPVGDDELVIIAVFEKTPRDDSVGSLTAKSFDESHLKRTNLSLVRLGYTSRSEFEETVVIPSGKGALVGVSSANVGELRSLLCTYPLDGGRVSAVRGLCIIDLVLEGDCDGHAAAGYCNDAVPPGVNDMNKGKRRSELRANMARTFSRIVPMESIDWPPKPSLA